LFGIRARSIERFDMNSRISSRSFAQDGAGFYRTVWNGAKLAAISGSVMKNAVIIFHSHRRIADAVVSIGARSAGAISREFAGYDARLRV
jgi:orotate phosphoribosyltransferase-like protein